MTIEDMKARKIELGLTNEMISEASGVPFSTVQKIFSGTTKAPRRLTLEAFQKVLTHWPEPTSVRSVPFDAPSAGSRGDGSAAPASGGSFARADSVRESAFPYGAVPKDNRHTIDDYYALPEDVRVELIDGVFYDMGAPAMLHQMILGDLYLLFRKCADEHDMPCEVYLSPCDVRLDRDNYTMVQPDLLVICGEYDAGAVRYEGAPDLCVEILSPSTRMKDMILKLHKYQNAGVREYWIVDPKHRAVTVHLFEDSEDYDPKKYSFDDTIPIGISDGDCSIDFSGINEKLKRHGV